jgi:hypothetical protein
MTEISNKLCSLDMIDKWVIASSFKAHIMGTKSTNILGYMQSTN